MGFFAYCSEIIMLNIYPYSAVLGWQSRHPPLLILISFAVMVYNVDVLTKYTVLIGKKRTNDQMDGQLDKSTFRCSDPELEKLGQNIVNQF